MLKVSRSFLQNFSFNVPFRLSRSALLTTGLSLQTQELLLLVSLSRCLAELLNSAASNLELLYYLPVQTATICMSAFVCYTMRWVDPTKSTYRPDLDIAQKWSFPFIVLPCLVATFLLANFEHVVYEYDDDQHTQFGKGGFSTFDLRFFCGVYLWCFSAFLGSACLLPQITMFRYHRHIDIKMEGFFVLLMGSQQIFFLFSDFDPSGPSHMYLLQYNDGVPVYSICLLLFITIVGLFLQKTGGERESSTWSGILGCCRETPWRTIAAVIVFVPFYAVCTVGLPGWLLDEDPYVAPATSIFLASIALLCACNPVVAICFCFFHFHKCCPKARESASLVADLEMQVETDDTSPNDSLETVGGRDCAVPSISTKIAEEQRELDVEIFEEEDEPLFSLTPNVRWIWITFFVWASVVAFCIIALWSEDLLIGFFLAIIPMAGCCLYCCVPRINEPEDLTLYEEVPEHEMSAMAPPEPRLLDQEEKLPTALKPVSKSYDKEAGASTAGTKDPLKNPLLTVSEQEASVSGAANGQGAYKAPVTDSS